jgi:hypothetical protein
MSDRPHATDATPRARHSVVTLARSSGNAPIGSAAPLERRTDRSAQADNPGPKNAETGRDEIARVTEHDRIATVNAADALYGLRIAGSATECRCQMSNASA